MDRRFSGRRLLLGGRGEGGGGRGPYSKEHCMLVGIQNKTPIVGNTNAINPLT